MISEIQNKIKELKNQKDMCILSHIYMNRDITETADFTGDYLQLIKYAHNTEKNNILVCGVRGIAETIKSVMPHKNIYTSDIDNCDFDEQITAELIMQMKSVEPERTVVAHIDTSSEIKAVSDICVATENMTDIITKLNNEQILFISDRNTGDYIRKSIPKKNIRIMHSSCPIHSTITLKEVENLKKNYPDALVLVSPKCIPEVVEQADYVGSAMGIVNFARQCENRNFIIGTEIGVKEMLQHECPDKNFILLSKKLIYTDMKTVTLCDILNIIKSLDTNENYKIIMPENIMTSISDNIRKMNELSAI